MSDMSDIEQRVERLEEADAAHSQSLQRMGTDLQKVMIESGFRNSFTDDLKKFLISIIVVGLLQFGATVWWAARIDLNVSIIAAKVENHERRISEQEQK